MAKTEDIEGFYKSKLLEVPGSIKEGIGHFNVFKLDPFVGAHASPVPYKKRDYYKITLAIGHGRVHFADKLVEVQKQALTFSNPMIPYKWEDTEQITGGYFCIFTKQFFHEFGSLERYSVYQPGGTPVFELTDRQVTHVKGIYERMLTEITTDYIHKYDVLRNLVFELLHFAMKMQPSSNLDQHPINAARRITTLFLELLERQFPIDENHQQVELRTAADFAGKLAVHVNHLNSAVKDVTGKTTTEVIAERITQEAKVLLRHSDWNVSDIAFALGFREATHFSNFFRKHADTSPVQFRKTGKQ